jgi:hypothetical protein
LEKTLSSYLRFNELDLNTAIVSDGKPESGVLPRQVTPRKTKIWSVVNDEGEELGEVRWYGPWRQYCYFQKPDIIMSAGCLEEITNFLRHQMSERKQPKMTTDVRAYGLGPLW